MNRDKKIQYLKLKQQIQLDESFYPLRKKSMYRQKLSPIVLLYLIK